MADLAVAPPTPSASSDLAEDGAAPTGATTPFGPKVTPERAAFYIGAGWLATSLALELSRLPFQFLLKEELKLTAEAAAGFMTIANIPIYIKPFAGILSDAVPLWGTRRRHYVLLSLFLAGLTWITLALAPRVAGVMLPIYFVLSIFLTLTSTVLGGLMVEVGKIQRTTGKLSSQRLGITKIVGVLSGPVSGYLSRLDYLVTASLCASLQFILAMFYWKSLQEPRTAIANHQVVPEMRRQLKTLVTSRLLWATAGLVILVIAAPGFQTALLYYQTNNLGFSKQFVGILLGVEAVFAMLGAVIYGYLCARMPLRRLLTISIILHAGLTLFYLLYKTPTSAIIVTAIESTTMSLAILPLYDLAARATPRGSEALGYSLMMSVWNLTFNLSNLAGSWIYEHWGQNFAPLVWVNSGTTILVLFAVPFLPAALMDRRDGDPERH